MPNRYFKLRDDVGLDAAGNPEPVQTVGVVVNQPVMRDGEPVEDQQTLQVKAIADTRIVVTDDVRIVAGLEHCGLFEEITKPTAKQVEAEAKTTEAHRVAVSTTKKETA